MQSEEEKTEIRVQSYVWKSALVYLTGHYEFEIVVKNTKGKNQSQKTFYRRFSDFEILHEGLIKYNPGCRIPVIPEKSIWCNFYVNNDQSLEKRKRQIEEYLNYINNHKYLCLNPIYQIFLSDDFERYKTDYNKKSNFYDKIYSLKKYFPNLFKGWANRTYREENYALEKERDNLMRLDKGISEVEEIIDKYIKLNEERSEALKNIMNITKSLEITNLKIEQKDFEDDSRSSKKGMEKNVEIFFNLYDKNKTYCNNLNNNVSDLMKKYHLEIIGLKEIFERKDKIEASIKQLNILKNTEFDNDKYIELEELEEIYSTMDQQLVDEIINFKNYREKDLLHIFTKFFREKYAFDLEISNVYEINNNSLEIRFDTTFKNLDNNEDHFK